MKSGLCYVAVYYDLTDKSQLRCHVYVPSNHGWNKTNQCIARMSLPTMVWRQSWFVLTIVCLWWPSSPFPYAGLLYQDGIRMFQGSWLKETITPFSLVTAHASTQISKAA